MFLELIGMLIILRISAHISKRVKILTLVVIILLAFQTLIFNLEKYVQTFDHYTILRVIFTALQYSIYPIILLIFMLIIIEEKMSKLRFILILLPEIICTPLFFTSQWTKLVFYFSEENHYHGGPLAILPFVLFAFYALVFLVYNIIYFKKFFYIVLRTFISNIFKFYR